MIKPFSFLLLCLLSISAAAQTKFVSPVQAFGKVDVADLERKKCDFEPDANAMVLFDRGEIYYDHNFALSMERHKRIKIFNQNANNYGNIRLEYFSGSRMEFITGLQAQTINLVDGKPVITKLDKKQISTVIVDKNHSAIVFSMPEVKPGSILEYKYTWNTSSLSNFPDWTFQARIPTKYSELVTMIPDILEFKLKSNVSQDMARLERSDESRSLGGGAISYVLEKTTRGIQNIHSLPDEPYMSSVDDNLQSMTYMLTAVRPMGTFTPSFSDSWGKVADILNEDEDFGSQLKRKLPGEEAIVTRAKSMAADDDKIAYIFAEVRNAMRWDGTDRWYTNDGTVKAWERKSGNSAEVNIILCHLLKQAGVAAYPMIVSTRSNGKVVPYFTSLGQFNRAVAYVKLANDKTYVLDATNKYNSYKETPSELLGGMAIYIDREKKSFGKVVLERETPVRHVVSVTAGIKADGKMTGTAQINSFSYDRVNDLGSYKLNGEKKYIEYLSGRNNMLKVSDLKMENMEIDTLPLVQNVNFNMDLTGSDENYIYFVPNLFTSLTTNPFLAENRFTDVEFGYRPNYTINGIFTIPANYKIDAAPKSVSMMMPDSSILFRRIVASDAERVVVRYTIDYRKPTYTKENYPEFYDFCKKMYEMLNEQIVLKKS